MSVTASLSASHHVELTPDFDLSPHNTLGLEARARFGTTITNANEAAPLLEEARRLDLPLRVLGGGSNVVLRPFYDGVVARMSIKGRAVVSQTASETVVEFGAGEDWHEAVCWTVAQGLPGLENLAGIPGTMGAAPVQNIGAYGCELVDRFVSLVAFDTSEQAMVTFDRAACDFSYRQSVFKSTPGRFIVVSVKLSLPREWRPNLAYPGLNQLPEDVDAATILETVVAVRQSKLPDWRRTGNAGSFFHNPIVPAEVANQLTASHINMPRYPQADGRAKLSAAWLIEQSGFKGYRLGGAGVSERHALVVVNNGGATQAEIAELAERITSAVRDRFGVSLVQEPELI
jgi:UDP-N-acetylmuramate dehydrogenase